MRLRFPWLVAYLHYFFALAQFLGCIISVTRIAKVIISILIILEGLPTANSKFIVNNACFKRQTNRQKMGNL